MSKKKEDSIEAKGTIIAALGGDKFEVQLESGHTVKGYIAGRMRKNWIKIVPGDKVTIELSPYDLTQGRIIYREK